MSTYSRFVRRLKAHRKLAIVLFIGSGVIAVSKFTGALSDLKEFFHTNFGPPRYLTVEVYRKSPTDGLAIGTRVIVHTFVDAATREERIEEIGFARFSDIRVPTGVRLQLNEKRDGAEWAYILPAFDIIKLPKTLSYNLSEIPEDKWIRIAQDSPGIAVPNVTQPLTPKSTTARRQIGDRSLQRINAPWGVPDAKLIINRYAYILGIDPEKRIPRWVAYSFAPTHQRIDSRPRPMFRLDPAVPADMQAQYDDFRGSGYDRGHLVSASDVRFKGGLAVQEAYYLSALTPQTPYFNRRLWLGLENATRSITDSVGQFYIIAGPLFLDSGPPETIGENAIPVPTHFFRVILWVSEGEGLQAAAYLAPNHVAQSADIRTFAVSISDIELKSGLKLLPDLDSTSARSLKKRVKQIPGL